MMTSPVFPMKPVLKSLDYALLPSVSKQIRWRNTAQWARNKMVNEDGRMKKNSPREIWEISSARNAQLKKYQS